MGCFAVLVSVFIIFVLAYAFNQGVLLYLDKGPRPAEEFIDFAALENERLKTAQLVATRLRPVIPRQSRVAVADPSSGKNTIELSKAHCLVCGKGFAHNDTVVKCQKCQTPHHAECFDYIGRCAIFACSESS